MLVRSTATNWVKDSLVAVDAGTHLSAIIRILQESLPPVNGVDGQSSAADGDKPVRTTLSAGPFAGLEVPHKSAKANAAHVTRDLVSTYLITHPHLDHLSGFVVNTASFQHTSRPKRLAALPQTIDAIKAHLFNDVIWPNLTDEEGGVGLVTYMRLVEGGNDALGHGSGKGYIEVCNGLAAKCSAISHGHCMKKHYHRGSSAQLDPNELTPSAGRRSSADTLHGRRNSQQVRGRIVEEECVYDSSAFFIRDDATGKEILIFGDVEPDSLSLSPRTEEVWADAAPKIASGALGAIFIECSYPDHQPDELLFGHLNPHHLTAELQMLASKVVAYRAAESSQGSSDRSPRSRKKRKRIAINTSIDFKNDPELELRQRKARAFTPSESPRRGSSFRGGNSTPMIAEDTFGTPPIEEPSLSQQYHQQEQQQLESQESMERLVGALTGLHICIIHVKESLQDGPDAGEVVLSQLKEQEQELQLGCNFTVTKSGQSIWV